MGALGGEVREGFRRWGTWGRRVEGGGDARRFQGGTMKPRECFAAGRGLVLARWQTCGRVTKRVSNRKGKAEIRGRLRGCSDSGFAVWRRQIECGGVSSGSRWRKPNWRWRTAEWTYTTPLTPPKHRATPNGPSRESLALKRGPPMRGRVTSPIGGNSPGRNVIPVRGVAQWPSSASETRAPCLRRGVPT